MSIRAGSSTRQEILTPDDIAGMATVSDLAEYQPVVTPEEITETEAGAVDAEALLTILENLGFVTIVPDPEE